MCRLACKLLRKSPYKNRLLDQKLKIVLPPLDCAVPGRWNSTYRMVRTALFTCNISHYYPPFLFICRFLLLFYLTVDRKCDSELQRDIRVFRIHRGRNNFQNTRFEVLTSVLIEIASVLQIVNDATIAIHISPFSICFAVGSESTCDCRGLKVVLFC